MDPETILIVDDEEPVRRTFREWLEGARLGCTLLTAADSASALEQADRHAIDLAILDWNLGAGSDGLQLLQDLQMFWPDMVAIMVTGYANQATPLHAMRMGVRDYLDKDHDLDRQTFLEVVRRQLDRIRPARVERRVAQGVQAFRSAIEKVLPLVQTTSALQEAVPLPEAVRSLLRFLARATGARDGVLLVHSHDPSRQPADSLRVHDLEGAALDLALVPFARSVAGSVVSLGEPAVMADLGTGAPDGALELQPFERGRRNLLAAPLDVAPGVQVVVELFDKEGGFQPNDRALVKAAGEVGAELLRQVLTERQTQQVLIDALETALKTSEEVAHALEPVRPARPEDPPPDAILAQVRQGLRDTAGTGLDADRMVRLAEAVRVLAVRYGPPALDHCTKLIEGVRGMLDEVTGEASA